MIRRSIEQSIVGALLAGSLVGCATPVRTGDIADLESRARSWWSARQAGDVRRMYEMFEPSWRAGMSLGDFEVQASRLSRISIENPRIESVSRVSDSNRAIVKLVAQTRLPRAGIPVDIEIHDQWVLEDEQWWRVYVPPRSPFE